MRDLPGSGPRQEEHRRQARVVGRARGIVERADDAHDRQRRLGGQRLQRIRAPGLGELGVEEPDMHRRTHMEMFKPGSRLVDHQRVRFGAGRYAARDDSRPIDRVQLGAVGTLERQPTAHRIEPTRVELAVRFDRHHRRGEALREFGDLRGLFDLPPLCVCERAIVGVHVDIEDVLVDDDALQRGVRAACARDRDQHDARRQACKQANRGPDLPSTPARDPELEPRDGHVDDLTARRVLYTRRGPPMSARVLAPRARSCSRV